LSSNRSDRPGRCNARDKNLNLKPNIDRPDRTCGLYACDSENLIGNNKDRAYGTRSLNAIREGHCARSDHDIPNFACTGYARNYYLRRSTDLNCANRTCRLKPGNG
jgi:hypothetical protein